MPRPPRQWLLAALCLVALLATPAAAEMCTEDCPEPPVGSQAPAAAERAHEAQRAREARERAEALERELQAQRERARQQEQARLAALPAIERLLESRCGTCHATELVRAHRYGWLGWHTVVLRMQWLNGARLAAGERAAIVAHLARTQAAPDAQRFAEWAAAAALAALAPGAWFGWRHRRARRRSA